MYNVYLLIFINVSTNCGLVNACAAGSFFRCLLFDHFLLLLRKILDQGASSRMEVSK